ncbi:MULTISPECIES: DUF4443 domain-containing protein [Candidatus Nitrosocaldus]|jgi:hypothetical protein|uniref:DUF4443 domain-containing protein n=1 Tax=Candidatus Nitrosocaldus cavascurensis TaxID=2058097 RepID=A0A2K5ATD4_9ARCH|nr:MULTISPECIES: DUF4443 domain-containing protein [Candidatus Nitrosocaldus]SPC34891.1 conserved protein of unknown function [Candidatus Nitrosocaldus cavascurensis]
MYEGGDELSLLIRVCSRYAPSRMLSFNMAHVIVALQLMGRLGRVSRAVLMRELMLGEGSVKTMIKHMRMYGLVETSRAGVMLTSKGKDLYARLSRVMVAEARIPNCSIAVGEFNYAVKVRGIANAIRSGVEQRDAAIKVGALGATTLVYRGSRFIMPGSGNSVYIKEQDVMDRLKDLMPEEDDVIIIGSASNVKVAELAAKYAVLTTLLNMLHYTHNSLL